MFTTDFTETFGVEPIVCVAMNAVGTADLVSAVASAEHSACWRDQRRGDRPEQPRAAPAGAGVKIVHKAVAVRQAVKAQEFGADAASINGVEGAGHPGRGRRARALLIPAATSALRIPVIASGGIADVAHSPPSRGSASGRSATATSRTACGGPPGAAPDPARLTSARPPSTGSSPRSGRSSASSSRRSCADDVPRPPTTTRVPDPTHHSTRRKQ